MIYNEDSTRFRGTFCSIQYSLFIFSLFIKKETGFFMKENILIEKTLNFAGRIIKLHDYLIKDKKRNNYRKVNISFGKAKMSKPVELLFRQVFVISNNVANTKKGNTICFIFGW